MPILTMDGVCLRRGDRPVLDDVSASFAPGTTTALVGPSGAGKSSLLRTLNRLEEPHAGTVSFEGADIRDQDPKVLRRRVGMVFQTPIAFPGDIRANLGYALDVPVDDRTMAQVLETVHLEPAMLDREAAELSVGQLQRVCIARALIRDPAALLFDEPTSALDRDATATVERLVRELVASGLCAVVVTHDLDQAVRIADHAILLVAGRIKAQGAPDEVRAAWPRGGAG